MRFGNGKSLGLYRECAGAKKPMNRMNHDRRRIPDTTTCTKPLARDYGDWLSRCKLLFAGSREGLSDLGGGVRYSRVENGAEDGLVARWVEGQNGSEGTRRLSPRGQMFFQGVGGTTTLIRKCPSTPHRVRAARCVAMVAQHAS